MRSTFSRWTLAAFGMLLLLGNAGPDSTLEIEDYDYDDLTNEQEKHLGTDPKNRDSDADGLWDGWEFNKRMLGVPLPDAKPLGKDVFVEIDVIKGAMTDTEFKLFQNECNLIVDAFQRHQIVLHLEWDQQLPAEENISTSSGLNPQGRWGELRDANFASEKALTHRHALIVKSYQEADQKLAALYPEEGQAFTIKASSQTREMAVLFMRGLGKSLGLAQGGLSSGYAGKVIRDESPEKPNHLSVMNGAFSKGVERRVDGKSSFELIYQDFDLHLPIDERKILESKGLGRSDPLSAEMAGLVTFNRSSTPELKVLVGATMDWNNENGSVETLRNIDLNFKEKTKINTHLPTLNEWTRLRLPSGSMGNFARYLQELSTPLADDE
jgi:hypothetical protein